MIQIRVEKEGFESKYASLSVLGRETTFMDLKLSSAQAASTEVRKAFELNRQLLQEANRLAAAKRFSEALARIERVIETDPKNDEAHAAKGSLMYLMKDFDGAQTAWKRALQLNPSNDLVRSSLVDLNLNTNAATRSPTQTGR
ncbi:MAG: tetratricopeptide repeat protein [Calothrix sp. SM1_5_4]|nr:tetratricopeptide repeat protein [Calothrix sp. SM1_5_4]